MRAIAIGFASLALFASAASAQTAATTGGSCAQAVRQLDQEWQMKGYPMPTKGTPGSLTSVDGLHHADASAINYARLRIRLAHQACNEGNDAAALTHVAAVRGMLEAPTAMASTSERP
jgi:hypothetical protein